MQKTEAVSKNETHKISWDFEMQTDQPVQVRKQNLVSINKKKEL